MAAWCNHEQAEKALQRADELFLAGNIGKAHRLSRKAQRLCPSLPGITKVLAAYDVHAAAASENWYAVLGIDLSVCSAVSHDAIKQQYRRLCLLVHSDKNHSAAADGSFKFVQEALRRLSDHHPPTDAAYKPQTNAPPVGCRGYWPQPESIYCPHCNSCFGIRRRPIFEEVGVLCYLCSQWLKPPLQYKQDAAPEEEPPGAPSSPTVFPCPGRCPHCGTNYASMVSVGLWPLRCKACFNHAW